MSDRSHWETVYAEKEPEAVSWFEPVPRSSLEAIEALDLPREAPLIDIGAGASRLAGELVARGFSDVTAADISARSLERARAESADADRIRWVVADVREHDFGRRFALWHDRAVFHFMVSAADRAGYLATLERSVEPDGHVILASFGPQGPTECSGLPTARYGAEELAAVFDGVAELVSSRLEEHRTPSGAVQQFLRAHLARRDA
jgi:SAM-dependent methyltransferase